MRKILILGLMIFLSSQDLGATTDPQTAQFLRKLNLYYYCPSREGLKGFTCLLTLSVSEVFKKSLEEIGASKNLMAALDGQKFNLKITADGKRSLSPVEPVPSGDLKFDAQLKQQLKDMVGNLNPVFETWTGDVFRPGFDEETLSKTVCGVTNQTKGFIVDQKADDGSDARLTYDSKWKLNEIALIPNSGVTLLDILFNYSHGPKGYQLDSYQGTSVKMNAYEADYFTYEPIGKYILPKRIIKEMQLGNMFEKGSAITVDFSNYQLTQ